MKTFSVKKKLHVKYGQNLATKLDILLLEVNFNKPIIGLHFLFISSILKINSYVIYKIFKWLAFVV